MEVISVINTNGERGVLQRDLERVGILQESEKMRSSMETTSQITQISNVCII